MNAPRRDGVDSDSARPALAGQADGCRPYRCLRRAVDKAESTLTEIGFFSRKRLFGDGVDHPAPPTLRPHHRPRGFGRPPERAIQMQRKCASELFLGEVLNRRAAWEPSIVDDDVDLAERLRPPRVDGCSRTGE